MKSVSRWLAVFFFVPVLLGCLSLGLGFVYVGLTELRGALFSALVGVGAGTLSLFLTVMCFRQMRHILAGQVAPWGRPTWVAIASDVFVLLLLLIAFPKIEDQRRFMADSAARRQLRSLQMK
jgi:hypothetical protein